MSVDFTTYLKRTVLGPVLVAVSVTAPLLNFNLRSFKSSGVIAISSLNVACMKIDLPALFHPAPLIAVKLLRAGGFVSITMERPPPRESPPVTGTVRFSI